MALDPNLKNNIDPNVWDLLVQLDARIDALPQMSGTLPQTIVFENDAGEKFTWERQP